MKTFNKENAFCIANAEDAIQYLNKECYFEDSYAGLQYCIDNNIKGLLKCIRDDDDDIAIDCIFVVDRDIKVMDSRCIRSFGFCLPCELVKEEPKYRAFNSIEEFEKTLNIKLGGLVEFMDTTIRRTALYTGNAIGISGTQYITLGGYAYQFKDLFDYCKLILDGKLVPFGILDEE